MAPFAEAVAAVLLVIGAIFLFVGSFGLARLPDTMRRLHGPTKATTLGVGCTLLASMVWFGGVKGDLSLHELMITLFLFLSAPVTGQMISKAHMLRSEDTQKDLPESTTGAGWATLSPAPSAETRPQADRPASS